MNRTTQACYALLASAFVLAAILLIQLQSHDILSQAQASMVIHDTPVSAMTLKSRNGEEVLCILEDTSQRLLIYRTDLTRNQLRLVQNVNLARIFGNIAASCGSTGGGSRSSR
ncbi:MAG: hypothetical protein JKX85_04075 [Phycisphaeraceae bacterium]|nr:hypothetical protein [Phycisphaeraceae bacterium]